MKTDPMSGIAGRSHRINQARSPTKANLLRVIINTSGKFKYGISMADHMGVNRHSGPQAYSAIRIGKQNGSVLKRQWVVMTRTGRTPFSQQEC